MNTCKAQSLKLWKMGSESDSYKEEIARRLKEYGTKLLDPPRNVFQLFQILEKLEQVIAVVEQGPSDPVQSSLKPAMKGLIEDAVLKHKNVDIRISVVYCFAEIMRITAPDSPYNDEEMKELFQLMVDALESLAFLYSPNFIKTVSVLESVAKFKSCVVMLDLEMDDLVIEMITKFFEKIRSNHPSNLFTAMETIITSLIEESEDISAEFLNPLLESVRKNSQYLSPRSWKLGEKVFRNCAAKLKPYLVEAVKGVGNGLDNFSEIIAHICESDSIEQNHDKSSQENTDNENKLDGTNPDQPYQNHVNKLHGTDPGHPSQNGGNKLDRTNPDQRFQDNVNKLDRTDPRHPYQDGENKLERTDPGQQSQVDVNKLDRTDPGQPSQVEPAPYDVSSRDAGHVSNASKLHVSRTDASYNDRNPKESGTSSKGLEPGHTEHPNGTNAHGNAKTNTLILKMTVKSEAVPGSVSKKRDRKPNSLLRSEEGYDHSWISAGRKDAKLPRCKRSSGKRSSNMKVTQSLIDASPDGRQHKRGRPKKGDSMIGPDSRSICLSPKREDALNVVSPIDPSSFGGQTKRRPKKSGSQKRPADAVILPSSRENLLNVGVEEETLQSGSGGKGKEIAYGSGFTAKPQSCARDMDVGQTEHGTAITLGCTEKIGQEKPTKKRHVIRSSNDRKEASDIKKAVLGATVSPKTGLEKKHSGAKDKVPEMYDLDAWLVGKRIKVWWPLDKMYYEGVIDSYDPVKKKHKVFYTDGDVENLNLYKQKWEWIPDDDPQEETDLQIIGASSARVTSRKRKSKLAKEFNPSPRRLEAPMDNKGVETAKSGTMIPLVAKPDRPRVDDSETETSSDTDINDFVVKPTGNSKMKLLTSSAESSSETETESDTGSPKGGMKPCSAGRPRSNALFIKD